LQSDIDLGDLIDANRDFFLGNALESRLAGGDFVDAGIEERKV